jgi:cyanoexosortase A
MTLSRFASAKPLNNSQFWLLGIAVSLITIHLTLTWKANNVELLSSSILFWLAVSSLVWNKRNSLSFNSGVFSSFFGASLIALVLLKSFSVPVGYFLQLSPFISGISLALLASGFKGLKQYSKELIILFFLGIPQLLLSFLIDPSLFTAKFTAFILWYLGFAVSRQGVYINLPTGGIEVYSACSGLESIMQLLGMAVLVVLMFSLSWVKKIIVLLVAVSIAFVVNGIRVAIMAVLVASSNQKSFHYWHTGDGSVIFSMVAVLLFGLFCLFLLRKVQPENQDRVESQRS